MTSILPLDVVDLVIGQLNPKDAVERRTIGLCGLVCMQWRRPSRFHFFSEVHLSDSNLKSFLNLVETSPFPISRFIRLLVLETRGFGGGPSNIGKLGPLPGVTALHVATPFDMFVPISTNLALMCPSLASLTFATSLPLHRALAIAHSFPSLTCLGFRYVTLDGTSSADAFPHQCHNLELRLHGREMENFFQWVLARHRIPVFSRLCLLEASPKKDSFSGEYLRFIGDSLHHLEIVVHLQYIAGADVDLLKISTGLRHLVLHFDGLHPHALLWNILPSLRCPNLTTLTFFDTHECVDYPSELLYIWRRLDQALADERFANLQTFTIRSPSPFVQRLPESMRLSVARKLLRATTVTPAVY